MRRVFILHSQAVKFRQHRLGKWEEQYVVAARSTGKKTDTGGCREATAAYRYHASPI